MLLLLFCLCVCVSCCYFASCRIDASHHGLEGDLHGVVVGDVDQTISLLLHTQNTEINLCNGHRKDTYNT